MSEEITTHEAAEAVEFGAERVGSSRAIVEAERVMPTDFAHNAAIHYAKAMRKHPRFADALFDWRELTHPFSGVSTLAQSRLKSCRRSVATGEQYHRLIAGDLLNCEIAEAFAAHEQGNAAETVSELYDTVAVLMRMIAVVEGKQKLGGAE